MAAYHHNELNVARRGSLQAASSFVVLDAATFLAGCDSSTAQCVSDAARNDHVLHQNKLLPRSSLLRHNPGYRVDSTHYLSARVQRFSTDCLILSTESPG
jgi:hypothetical protein